MGPIKPTENELRYQAFELEYDVNQDVYFRRSDGNRRILGWQSLAYEFENIFRKEEHDHKMRYLSRTPGSRYGKLSWNVDLNSTHFQISEVEVFVSSTVFQNGQVIWSINSGSNPVNLQPGMLTRLDQSKIGTKKQLILTAILSGGQGQHGWQHAQLFRTRMMDNNLQFKLLVRFMPQAQLYPPLNAYPSAQTITPTENEIHYQIIDIDYDVNQDVYIRRSNGNQRIQGWQSLAYDSENMFRKEEHDHKMRYLSRTGIYGKLSWKVDLTYTTFEIAEAEILVNSTTFDLGNVDWLVQSGMNSMVIRPGTMNKIQPHQLGGNAKQFVLTANLSGAKSPQWGHWVNAQVFRTKMSDSNYQFKLLVKLRPQNQYAQPYAPSAPYAPPNSPYAPPNSPFSPPNASYAPPNTPYGPPSGAAAYPPSPDAKPDPVFPMTPYLRPTVQEMKELKMDIVYDISNDNYIRLSDNNSKVYGWSMLAMITQNMTKSGHILKVKAGESNGVIAWNIFLEGLPVRVESLNAHVKWDGFHDKVSFELTGDGNHLPLESSKRFMNDPYILECRNFNGSKNLILKINIKSGFFNDGKLFPNNGGSKKYPFRLTVKFAHENAMPHGQTAWTQPPQQPRQYPRARGDARDAIVRDTAETINKCAQS